MKSSHTIVAAIIFGGIVIAGAVYLSLRHVPANPRAGNPALVRPVGTNDHILGNPAAQILIIEYTDFDCEFCKNFNDTLHQIIANEGAGGKVAWVLREFPLVEIHPNAFSHARAAECAAQVAGNDAFWKFTDTLFANQPIDPSKYGAFAASAGLSTDKAGISGDNFAACFASASPTIDAHINSDRQNAFDIGAQGTPYSLILAPGKALIVMDGAYSYDAVKQLIDQALQSTSPSR